MAQDDANTLYFAQNYAAEKKRVYIYIYIWALARARHLFPTLLPCQSPVYKNME